MFRKVITMALAAVVAVGLVTVPADPAEAATARQRAAIVKEVKKHVGKRYQWGAAGPNRFDCSGLALYVTRKATGKKLPRTAHSQMNSEKLKPISRAKAKPGDFVFFTSGGRAYHVGIYAGKGKMWDAGTTRVKYRKIWTYNGVRFRTLK